MPLKNKIKDSFSKAAHKYNESSHIQKEVATKLSLIANEFIKDNDIILDLGCGTGFLGDQILKYKSAKMFACDISQNMLNQVSNKQTRVNCDFENLQLENNKFDIVVSSFAFQWSLDLKKVFMEANRVLKNNSKLLFCVPLKGSLSNLKNLGINSINEFKTSKEIIDSLNVANFQKIYFEEEIIRQKYQNPLTLLKEIKNIGANLAIDNNDNKNNLISLRHHNSFENYWNIGYFVFEKK